MKHLDLFSGIGGFALATEMVWGRGQVEHVFCDNEPFAQAVLKKHWPNSKIYGDIRSLTLDSYTDSNGRTGRDTQEHPAEGGEQTQHDPPRRAARLGFDLLTGGFPCQPFSAAGRRRGTEDDRHLWPEMLRVIREFSPRWVIGENVGGFVTWNDGMVFEQVHADLEATGYEVQAFIIPAVALNAPHRRDRVWIVAHSTSERWNNGINNQQGRHLLRDEDGDAEEDKSERDRRECGSGTVDTDASNTRRGDGNEGSERIRPERIQRQPENSERFSDRTGWSENWLEVATQLCTLDDGLPNGLARPRGWRNAALKGAGNAIVPQVAAEIMRTIKEIDV